ncbi:hypothetical protein E1B28_006027 [Marasmius oreades]|uniref:HTH cro/C1-type domain-containing protein n=1 Tax=Marasmius oreades TaxID=181124 RepID=A0A9P7UWA9_9AGAR|nr:uncharacterized protein E1B28_006027 [Marasmius oreades]KAG7095254.1 hypothetical protein E1B28_006027 [Marasmius oreades]
MISHRSVHAVQYKYVGATHQTIFIHPLQTTIMAPNPQCAALNNAKTKKGLSYAQIAESIGQTEQHVTDVCTGKVKPTQEEFNALAKVLGITDQAPNDSAHKTV